MIRWLFAILGGIVLGGIVHLVSVLALPRVATKDAYSRLTPVTNVNQVAQLPQAEPRNAVLPFQDPAFATAVCRYDLSFGSLKFSVPVSQAYTSVSFYTRNEVAYYAINDRSAGRRRSILMRERRSPAAANCRSAAATASPSSPATTTRAGRWTAAATSPSAA